MPFDLFSSVSLPPTTSLAEAEACFDRLVNLVADLPGVTLQTLLTDAGPDRPDMSPQQRNLMRFSTRLIPYTQLPPRPVHTRVGRMTATLLPPVSRPLLITASPRIGVTFEVAPGCDPFWFALGRLEPDLVPVAPPGMEGVFRAFCPPGWQGMSLVITETAMDGQDGGIPNAVAAHLASVGILDRMREAGFMMRVCDQGDFHTDRDVKHLVRTLGRVRMHRIGQDDADINRLLSKLAQALGRGVRLKRIRGPTRESAARLSKEPDCGRKAQAEDRILDLLRVVSRRPRPADVDADLSAIEEMLGL